MAKKKHNDYGTGIPKHEIEALARCLLPEIRKFFESEEGKQEFEEWKKKKGAEYRFGTLPPFSILHTIHNSNGS